MLELTPDQRATVTAAGQAGLISLAQLLACGLKKAQVHYRIRVGRLIPEAPRVYRIAGTPDHPDRIEWAAHLWAQGEGALALGCAARRWGYRRFERDPVSIAIIGDCPHRNLPFKAHRFGPDTLMHVTKLGEFWVTSIPKTVMDLIGRRDRRARWVLDRSLIDRACTLNDYWLLHDDPEMRGHRGRALLRERLELRGAQPPNETKAERALWSLMVCSGRFRLPQRQFWLTLRNRSRIRFDFAYPDLLFAIEVDEYEAHAETDPFSGDRWRDAEAALLGWFVLRIPDFDVYERPNEVLEMIAAHLTRFESSGH